MNEKITFGKYKGKSIDYISNQDRQYVKWLCSQKWYKENYNQLYKLTIDALEDNKPKINQDKFIIYTDGSCPNNGTEKARAGIGIHFSEKNPIRLKDISQELDVQNPSNNVAELYAIYYSLKLLKKNNINLPIEIFTDSSYCRSILIEWYQKWVDNDLLQNKKNLSLIKKTYNLYRSFKNIEIIHVKGHSKKTDEHSYGNNIADKLARNAFNSTNILQ